MNEGMIEDHSGKQFGDLLMINYLNALPMPPTPLDHWWPHVVAMSRVSQITVISGVDGQFRCHKRVIWHACCAHFGTLGDRRAIQGHLRAQEESLWGPGLDS